MGYSSIIATAYMTAVHRKLRVRTILRALKLYRKPQPIALRYSSETTIPKGQVMNSSEDRALRSLSESFPVHLLVH
jgi:hypothetical protein